MDEARRCGTSGSAGSRSRPWSSSGACASGSAMMSAGAQRHDEQIRARFGALLERAAAGELASLGRRTAAAPQPHHAARSVSAPHVPRHGARLRLRRAGAVADALRDAVGGGRGAGSGGTDLLLHADAARRKPRGAGGVGGGVPAAAHRGAARAARALRGGAALGGEPSRDHRAVRALPAPQPRCSGAPSTAAEVEWLQRGGSAFGQ